MDDEEDKEILNQQIAELGEPDDMEIELVTSENEKSIASFPSQKKLRI